MKIFKYIVWSLLLFFTVFYFLPAGLLKLPAVQKKISKEVSSYLEDKLETKVSIERVDFELINQLIIKDLYLEDQSGTVLLQAKRLSAGFDFLPLLKKQIRIHSLQLYTFECNLSKETNEAPLNIQYIIDAFSSDTKKEEKTAVDLKINTINLRRGDFSYRIKDAMKTPRKFNPKDIRLKDFSAKIHLNKLNLQELDLKVNRLSFVEQSGFALKRLSFDLISDEKSTRIEHFLLKLKKTTVQLKDAFAEYSILSSRNKDLDSIHFQLEIEPSEIYPQEICAFVPVFASFNGKVSASGKASGTPDDLLLEDFFVREPDFTIYTNAEVKNLMSNPRNVYLKGSVRNTYITPEGLDRLLNNFREEQRTLPREVYNMGTLFVQADFDGSPSNFLFHGNLNSDIGSLDADLNVGGSEKPFIKGYASSSSLDLGLLFNNADFGAFAFDIKLDAKQTTNSPIEGIIDATVEHFYYKQHRYDNLVVDGEFSSDHFKGVLDFDSPEGRIEAEGLFAFRDDNSNFQFHAEIDDLQLDKLNLTDKYGEASLSFRVDADFTGNNPDNILGDLYLHQIDFTTPGGHYGMDSLRINSSQWENEKKILVQSSVLNGEIYGIYSFSNIFPSIKQTLSLYLPSLVAPNQKSPQGGDSNFYLDFHISQTDSLSHVLKLPVTIQEKTRIYGQYNSIYNKFHLEADVPKAIIMGSSVEDLSLTLTNQKGKAEVGLSAITTQKKNNKITFDFHSYAENDSVSSSVIWGNVASKYRGNLNLDALFSRTEGKNSQLHTRINLHPSDMVFNDSIWTLYPTQIEIEPFDIRVDNLLLTHSDQLVNIRGAVSRMPEDEIFVRLNKVDLDYVFKSLAIKALTFGGIATGTVNAKDVFKSRQLSTKLDVKDFAFNNVVFGDLDLTGTWDDETQGILMDGWVYKNDSTTVDVDGVIYPVAEEISIDFVAENADARFLRKYLDSVIQDVTGNFSGKLRLFGDLNNPTVEGNVFARDFRFKVDFLNAYYSFTDSVTCLPDEMLVKNVTLRDERGRTGTVNGYVKHQLFSDFAFSANLNFSDFLVFNASRSSNGIFYGSVFGSGTANLSGTEDLVNIDVNMRNTANSKITMNFMEEAEVAEYDFINFIKREEKPLVSAGNKNGTLRMDNGTEIRLNLMMDVTPEANIELVVDPLNGDKITAFGSGNMQIQYGTLIPMRVYGNYRLERGKYNFSMQQVIFRNFDIQEGSEIVFRGDPYVAELNIDARYTVTANLGDLDQELVKQNYSARNNIPVDCVLLLGGPLNHPTIGFDLGFPGATSELSRQLKSYIRTEDMMSRQMVYLLVLGRFYTSPEYARGDYNNDYSYLTSTLSNQLSNLLGNISDKVQIGTKFHQTNEGEQTSTEVELLLSSQLLNDRLIINGNFGYIDNPYVNTAGQNVPLVGDFDIEYKLTKSGDIRLKGFNHYNYRNYFSQTPEMTQGLGILFRKDFNRFSELFLRWKKKAKEEAESEEQKPTNTD